MKHLTTLLLLMATIGLHAETWTHYYSYNDLTDVVPTQQDVYCLSAGALFAYHPSDGSLQAFNTTNVLNSSETIDRMIWNTQTQKLVLAYNDGTLDIMSTKDQSVSNIASIANQTTTLSKSITAMAQQAQYVYLTTEERLIILNTQREELGEAVSFATNGASFDGVWATADSVFVRSSATLSGFNATIIAASLSSNLYDREQWGAVSSGRAAQITSLIDQAQPQTYTYDSYRSCYWGADSDGLLMRFELNSDDNTYLQQWSAGVRPDGPASNDIYRIHWLYGKLYTVSEGWTREDDISYPGVVHEYSPTEGWTLYETPASSVTGVPYYSLSDIAVDPRNTSHVMVGGRSGLYEFLNGAFVNRWYNENSLITPFNDAETGLYQMVTAMAYNSSGLLYCGNAFTSSVLLTFSQSSVGQGSTSDWEKITSSTFDNLEVVPMNFKIDSRNRLWFIDNQWASIKFFSYHPTENALVTYQPLTNQDGGIIYQGNILEWLRDIAIDNNNNVWVVGTNGVCYLPAANIGTPTTTAYQYKVARNDGTGLADYLLSSVDASCILFDDANRMYVGTTNSGVYVVSADRNEQLQHWTTDDSQLLDNNVTGMAVDSSTGELYIATERGLCSVSTDAITVPDELDKDNIKVYPNPVPPSYNGMISIEGLTVDADVKITTATGYIVHEGRTSSARYQWDGCDLSGKKCASGIYNILLSDSYGEKGTVGKIAIVR